MCRVLNFENRLLNLYRQERIDIDGCLGRTERDMAGRYARGYCSFLETDRNLANREYVDGIHRLLCLWGMGRGGFLSSVDDMAAAFGRDEVTDCARRLDKKTIFGIGDEVMEAAHSLFGLLCCGENGGCLTKSSKKLVTFSKAMHFVFPHLFSPIDRKYTLRFFRNTGNVPNGLDSQFGLFRKIHYYYRDFANEARDKLEGYADDSSFNSTIPKVIDNIVMGYMLGELGNG